MKYEQEFDEGSSQWGHPHVSALEVYSLRVVQKAMGEGQYLLDLPAVSGFAEMVQCTVDEAVHTHREQCSHVAGGPPLEAQPCAGVNFVGEHYRCELLPCETGKVPLSLLPQNPLHPLGRE